jgi:uncharacterized membrane protein
MYKFTRRYKFIMGNEFKESVDISLEKKLCAFGLLGSMFGGFIPLVGLIISLGGVVAYIIGIFYFSKKLNNGDIFKNFILGSIVVIIGGILCIASLYGILLYMSRNFHSLSDQAKIALVVMIIVVIFVLWLSFVLYGFFSKKYLDIFYEYTNDNLFKYAGLVVLVGSFLFGTLSYIGLIIAVVAFFRMPDSLESNQS